MPVTSNTGLLPCEIRTIFHTRKHKNDVQLRLIAKPVNFVAKPFFGIYNPYPYGCSLLCNHPTDFEARELLKRARDTWTYEGKSLLLAEEIDAIKANLENFRISSEVVNFSQGDNSVPEELFRRYTETDSRPLTPAPTITSNHTRNSGSRRCVTPNPEMCEKKRLILDLRRSHSQETISWCGGSGTLEPPLIRIQQVQSKSVSPSATSCNPTPETNRRKIQRTSSPKANDKPSEKEMSLEKEQVEEEKGDDDDGIVKRKGKRRKKRGRDLSGGPASLQQPADPETQVSTIAPESQNVSARPSLVPQEAAYEGLESFAKKRASGKRVSGQFDYKSYLKPDILRHLRRELTEQVKENEFNPKKRVALEEALKTIDPNKEECEELVTVQTELNLQPVNTELWLTLPRLFSRSSARFELPIDSRLLTSMTPLDYAFQYVYISSPRKILYSCVFDKFRLEDQRLMHSEKILSAIGVVLGEELSADTRAELYNLLQLSIVDYVDYRTFCGLCAICERVLGKNKGNKNHNRKAEPPHEIEVADFEALESKLEGKEVNQNLIKILKAIKYN